MTGFGRGVAEHHGVRATVDIRTVNHRFLDLKLRGAPLAPAVEETVSQKIRAAIERGSVAVSVHVARAEATPVASRIDSSAAAAAHSELTALASKLGIAGPDLALVLQQPGVLLGADRETDDAALGTAVAKALDAALAQLDQMRMTEGAALVIELQKRMTELSTLRTRVAELAAGLPAQLVKRLQERLAKLLGDTTLEPARLAQEVALLADRADVIDELLRLSIHLD
ncbi:YicC family protein [soil metagenome]